MSLRRYFNPVGAHETGENGEDPQGIPNNLLPFIAQVAIGQREYLSVFCGDYPTKDGSCERDYIHVVDLAKGHIAALGHLQPGEMSIYNPGTGQSASVLQMFEAFERVNSVKISYKIIERRTGDLPAFWVDADKAKKELGWYPEKSLDDMMRDTWC